MAIFRKVHTQFWSDPFVQTLSPEKRYFFLYLLTNEKTRQCGIYEISKRHISYDTGYTIDTVSILLTYFISEKKILFSEDTNEIAIKNWNKYNGNPSPKVQKLVNEELAKVKNKKLILYLYHTDTVSIHNRQEEEEEEREREKEKKEKSPPKEFLGIVVYNAEEEILKNQKEFERICMLVKDMTFEKGKECLHKYHLWLESKEQYPKGKKAVFAGFEGWILNEKKFNQNGTNKQSSGKTNGRATKSSGAELLLASLKDDINAGREPGS